ncbi:MAG: glycosyltransferase [Candidatus Omnitrophota bacterium]
MAICEKVSVILPTYNEKDNIASLVQAIQHYLCGRLHEIIVIDDNSVDGTFEKALQLRDSSVKVFSRRQKRSLAESIKDGLRCCEGNIVVVMDSDFNHQPHYLPLMLDMLLQCDGVFASRFLPGGGMANRLRYCLSAVFNSFARRFFHIKATDCFYGFFAIKKQILSKCCYDEIFYGHGDYCMRLLFYLQKIRAYLLEVPVINGRRLSGRRKMGFLVMFWRYLVAMKRLKKMHPERVYV